MTFILAAIPSSKKTSWFEEGKRKSSKRLPSIRLKHPPRRLFKLQVLTGHQDPSAAVELHPGRPSDPAKSNICKESGAKSIWFDDSGGSRGSSVKNWRAIRGISGQSKCSLVCILPSPHPMTSTNPAIATTSKFFLFFGRSRRCCDLCYSILSKFYLIWDFSSSYAVIVHTSEVLRIISNSGRQPYLQKKQLFS